MNCRKNVSQMTDLEKTAYVNAVLALKAAPILQVDLPDAWDDGARNRYDVYVWIHMLIGGGAHRGPAFAPWHREILRQFELELQGLSGDPKITIPYWDWIEYRSLADNSPDATGVGAGFPFTDGFMGGMGTGADDRVETGSFAEVAGFWNLNVITGQAFGDARDNTSFLRRLTGQNPNDLPPLGNLTFALEHATYDAAPFQEIPASLTPPQLAASFRKVLEYALHNGPHGWVGGNMMPSTSPNDPVFFLHHCNVDRIWATWQQRNPGGINNYLPAAGLPGHDLNAVMSMLDQDFFLHPVYNTPAQVLDHKALGAMYDTDLPTITPLALGVNFGVVPENTTTYLPVQFNVETCRKISFRISAIGGDPAFEVPDFVVPYEAVVLPNEGNLQTAEVYIKLNATSGLGAINGMATIEAYIDDSQPLYSNVAGDFLVGTWNVNFNADVIARPQSAICLVLDKSGSMSNTDGTAVSRYEMLETAVASIRDILRPDDGVGMVYYDTNENRLLDITEMSAGGSAAVTNALANPALNPGGNTAIGKGMIEAADVLNDEINTVGTPYSNFGMLVMTDGNENVAPYISSPAVNAAISGLEDDIYAVGLGAQGGVSDAALSSISRYLLITGDMQGDERLFRLTNYFVQVLADIKKNDIILDPIGRLFIGAQQQIKFEVNEADIYADAIILSPLAPFINVSLMTPDGTIIKGSMGNVSHTVNLTNQLFRITFPALPATPNGSHAGTWSVNLELKDMAEIKKLCTRKEYRELCEKLEQYKSVPYSVTITTESDLKFKSKVVANANVIGAEIYLFADLSQYRLPISGTVRARVTSPDGKVGYLKLDEKERGQFTNSFKANQPGIYQFLILAQGYSLSGKRFTREALRSISVYRQEPKLPTDDRKVVGDDSNCKLLDCLLEQKEILELMKKNNIDPEAIKGCIEENAKSAKTSSRSASSAASEKESALKLIAKLQSSANHKQIVENMVVAPELRKVVFEKPSIPKKPEGPMMMPAFTLNKDGKFVRVEMKTDKKKKK